MITIVNIRNGENIITPTATKFRIDRRSPVGNPYPMKNESERESVCRQYGFYFKSQMEININIEFKQYIQDMIYTYKKYGKLYLYCWCYPKRCHGETIKTYILEQCK